MRGSVPGGHAPGSLAQGAAAGVEGQGLAQGTHCPSAEGWLGTVCSFHV